MKPSKKEPITDEMIGLDDKICRCSSVVADIISSGSNDKESESFRKALSALAKEKDQQEPGD